MNGLLEFKAGGRDPACIKYVLNYFGNQVLKDGDHDENDIKLTWTHAKGKSLGTYQTVHKAQGKTIDACYSIYEIERMDKKVLYTALSRCTDPVCISLWV